MFRLGTPILLAILLVAGGCGRGDAATEASPPTPEFTPIAGPCSRIDFTPVFDVFPFSSSHLSSLNGETESYTRVCTFAADPGTVRGGSDAQLTVGIVLVDGTELATGMYEDLRNRRVGFRQEPPADLGDGWDQAGSARDESGAANERLSRATVELLLLDGVLLLDLTFSISGFADADAQEAALVELAENVRTVMRR